MADAKLSALTAVTTLADTDEIYANDAGVSKRIAASALGVSLLANAGVTASVAELNFVDGVTSAIQTQLDSLLAGLVGEVTMYPVASAPTGYLLCDASAVSRATYSALFAVIGTGYGVGDGSTTFNVPDYRGRSPIGVGTGDATDATAWALAEKGGAETHTLSEAELAAYTVSAYNNALLASGGQTIAGEPGNGATLDRGGSDSPHNNMPPVLGINFIIKT